MTRACAYLGVKVFAGFGVTVQNDGNRSLRGAARTIAAPMPLAPPVTSTTLFSSCRSTVLSQSAVRIHETAIQR